MKKVLFVSVDFFYYTKAVNDELKRQGIDVVFYDCRPKLSSFQKWRMLRFKNYRKRIMDRYAQKIIQETKGVNFSLVLFNSTIAFDVEEVRTILSAFPGVPHVWYMWDSVKNFPIVKDFPSLFDRGYSFDKDDCQTYGLTYRPTFFDPQCLSVPTNEKKMLDIVFIGSANSERYRLLTDMKTALLKQNITCSYYLFIRNRLTYFFKKWFRHEYAGSKASDFIFKPVSSDEKNRILNSAKAVVDIPYSNQGGITMRAIEAAVIGCKYITTDSRIYKENLFSKESIAIISKSDFSSITRSFLELPTNSSPQAIEQYSVVAFVRELFLSNIK